jgi:hypothetical protein
MTMLDGPGDDAARISKRTDDSCASEQNHCFEDC